MTQQIIIIGAGPVGLTLALSLARQGFSITILEQQSQESWQKTEDARTFAINVKSCALLSNLGVWPEQNTTPIRSIDVWDHQNFKPLTFVDPRQKPLGYMVSAQALKAHLMEKSLHNPHIHLCFDTHIQTIDVQNPKVIVHTTNRDIEGSLLLAVDGRYSATRTLLNFSTQTHDCEQTALTGIVTHATPHHGKALELFTPLGPLALLPTAIDTSAFVFSVSHALADSLYTQGEQAILQFGQEHFPHYKITSIKGTVQKYPLHGIVCTKPYKNRVLLIGDASLALHPVAGQGLNVGLADVDTLVPHLKNRAALGLDIGDYESLRSFHKQRSLAKASMRHFTHSIVPFFSNHSPTLTKLRAGGVALVKNIPPLKSFLQQRASGG